jgi:hypothetical protein
MLGLKFSFVEGFHLIVAHLRVLLTFFYRAPTKGQNNRKTPAGVWLQEWVFV